MKKDPLIFIGHILESIERVDSNNLPKLKKQMKDILNKK